MQLEEMPARGCNFHDQKQTITAGSEQGQNDGKGNLSERTGQLMYGS